MATNTSLRLAIGVAVLALAACSHYVKREEFDATVADLRSSDQNLQRQIDALAGDLRNRLSEYDAKISAMQGRLRVETTAHFAFDDAALREQDKPLLDEFSAVIRDHHPNVLITVEGFADPAGAVAYNKKLGLRRADAVRGYLVGSGGLNPDKTRSVSYGEERNRQVIDGAWGPEGEPNRRVALVIDYVEHG